LCVRFLLAHYIWYAVYMACQCPNGGLLVLRVPFSRLSTGGTVTDVTGVVTLPDR
jgi:hypothetical protein